MKKEECDRRNLLKEELISDWDELNIAFKSLIIVGIILFIVIIAIAFFSDGETGLKHSLEVVFRSTLSSVFGFLLTSSIKANTNAKNNEIERIKRQLKEVESEVKEIYESKVEEDIACKLKELYSYKEINLVQILIAITICIVSIFVISILVITNNLDNVVAVTQLKDLMCSSVGFLIGESKKK